MKFRNIIYTTLLLLTYIFNHHLCLSQSWTNIEGGIFADYGTSLDLDNDGNLYILGDFSGAFDSSSITDLGLAKYNSSGNYLWSWSPQYFNNGDAYGYDLVTDSKNNVYIVGYLVDSVKIGGTTYTSGHIASLREFFMTRLDKSGNVDWTIRSPAYDTTFPGSISQGLQIEISKNDELYILIELKGDMILGSDSLSSYFTTSKYLVKMDTSGTTQWIRSGDAFQIDTSGNYYIASGSDLNKYDDGGSNLWNQSFSNTITTMSLNSYDYFYLIVDPDLYKIGLDSGKTVWSILLNTDIYHTLDADSLGNVVVSGKVFPATPTPWYTGTYFEKYDSASNFKGSFYWGNPIFIHNTIPFDIILSNDSFLYVLGGLNVTSTFPDTSVFVFGDDTLANIGNYDVYISKIKVADWLITRGNKLVERGTLKLNTYPNPFTFYTTVEIPEKYWQTNNVSILIYNLMGKEINRIENIHSNKIKINRENLPSGLYFYKLTDGYQIIATGKLAIQ